MRCAILSAVVGLSVFAGPAARAQAVPPQASAADSTAPPAAAAVPAGSPVFVELAQPVSSRTAKPGDMFPIRLVTPINLDGRLLVAAGAMGEGQVVDAGRTGALGRPAKLVLAARYIKTDSMRIDLRAFRLGAAGRDNSNTIMVASFVPYVGLLAVFMQGGEIEVPAGTVGQAKLAADLPAPVSAVAPSPAAQAAITSQ